MKIVDGLGRGFVAEVNSENKFQVNSVNEEQSVFETFRGRSYNINTGTISLTSTSESALLYVKNDSSTDDLVLTAAIYLLGYTQGTTGEHRVRLVRNPSAGTLISSGTAISATNRDHGSANVLSATLKKGAEGSTVTDGVTTVDSLFPSSGRYVIGLGALVLRPGNSIVTAVTPRTGTTSMNVQMAFSCFNRAI